MTCNPDISEEKAKILEKQYRISETRTPEYIKQLLDIENEDRKSDAQRQMTWFALFGMLLYPFFVVLSGILGLEKVLTIIGDMSSIYFLSASGIVMVFFGVNAYTTIKGDHGFKGLGSGSGEHR